MKFPQKSVLVLLLLLNFTSILYAQAKKNLQPTFQGVVRYDDGKRSGFDTLKIGYFRPNCPEGVVGESMKLVTDKDGNFLFKLPLYSDPGRMKFWINHNGVPIKGMGFINYLFEPDDDVKIEIIKNSETKTAKVIFSGKGSEKYNIAETLEEIAPSRGGPIGSFRTAINAISFRQPDDFENKLRQLELLTEKTEKLKADLINNSGMSATVKKMVSYNFGAIYHTWVWMMYNYYNRNKENIILRKAIIENFNRNQKRFSYAYDPLMAHCANYLANVALNESRYIYLASDKVTWQELYDVFQHKYDGLIRELLISNLFINKRGWIPEMGVNGNIIDSLMGDAEKFITTPFIKEVYLSKMRLSAGKEVFNGKFKDVNGRDLMLASLKGKVVFIDMWFTGCGACMEFHKSFHSEVYPRLKEDKDFLYVSLCIDKNTEQWLNSVKSGKYTATEYLNLNSTLGVNDPFFRYYNISGFPFLLLMDKEGKIVTSNIRPEPDVIHKLIKEALAK